MMDGVGDMSAHIVETSKRIDEIDAQLARLSRRPDPMTFDFPRAGMATREEAFESWENRHSHGWHHDQITRLAAQRDAAKVELTEYLGTYRTTAVADRQLDGMRETLRGIESGDRPPSRIDFGLSADPDEILGFDITEIVESSVPAVRICESL